MSKTDMESFTLISSAGTGYFYVNRKNKKKGKGKKVVKKVNPIARKHVLFEEKKLSRAKKAKGGQEPAVEAAKTEAKEAKKVKREVKKEAGAQSA